MPDESSASTEHAIMQEVTAPLATLPDDPVPVAADVDFPIVLRGYDRLAVDAYVKKTSQLVAELQATRSPEAAVRRALSRVGEEVSGILQRAHETASQITQQSRAEAEDRLEAARQEAEEITRAATDNVKELDLETDRIWEERLRIVEDARELARQLLALADSAVARFPAEETESTESIAQPEIAEIFSAAAEEEDVSVDLAPGEEDASVDLAPGEREASGDAASAAEGLATEGRATEAPEAEDAAGQEPAPAAQPDREDPSVEQWRTEHHVPRGEEDDPGRDDTAIMPAIRPPDEGPETR